MKGPAGSTSRKIGLPETAPPGTGRLTLAALCTAYGLDCQALITALEKKNITALETDSLRDIAQRHNTGPTDLYDTIRTLAVAIH